MTVDAINPSYADGAEMLEAAFLAHAASLRGRLTSLTRGSSGGRGPGRRVLLPARRGDRCWAPPLDAGAGSFRVGRNLAISRAVATRRDKAMPGLFDRGVAASPEDAVIKREHDEKLQDALASLAGEDRQIVVLAAQGYRPEEIAQLMGCTGAATRTGWPRPRPLALPAGGGMIA